MWDFPMVIFIDMGPQGQIRNHVVELSINGCNDL